MPIILLQRKKIESDLFACWIVEEETKGETLAKSQAGKESRCRRRLDKDKSKSGIMLTPTPRPRAVTLLDPRRRKVFSGSQKLPSSLFTR